MACEHSLWEASRRGWLNIIKLMLYLPTGCINKQWSRYGQVNIIIQMALSQAGTIEMVHYLSSLIKSPNFELVFQTAAGRQNYKMMFYLIYYYKTCDLIDSKRSLSMFLDKKNEFAMVRQLIKRKIKLNWFVKLPSNIPYLFEPRTKKVNVIDILIKSHNKQRHYLKLMLLFTFPSYLIRYSILPFVSANI